MERWDLYDSNLTKTGKIVTEESQIPNGFYHMSLEIWVINSSNHVLLTKNSIDYSKRYPGSWCCIGGNLIADETIKDGLKRILYNKIGMTLSLEKVEIKEPIKRDPYNYAYITCIVFENLNIKNIKFIDQNSVSAQYINKNELIKMCNNGEIAYYLIERINNEILKYLD